MKKWSKSAVFIITNIMGAYFFGTVCGRIDETLYAMVLQPTLDIIWLLALLLLSICILCITAGLIAALLRPIWVAVVAFILSGLALLLGWKFVLVSGILTVLYVVGGCYYSLKAKKKLDEQLRFRPISLREGQNVFVIVIIVVACGSFYLGCNEYVLQEGFSIPPFYTEKIMEQMEKQVLTSISEEGREQATIEFRKSFQDMTDDLSQSVVDRYQKYVPIGIAAFLFMPLLTVCSLLSWVPMLILYLIFPVLKASRVVYEVVSTRETRQLVMD